MKKLLIVLLMIFIVGCSSNYKISKEVDEVMNKDNYVIIDVRTNEEYEEGHILNAINIPYNEIDEHINISKDKDVFVYCKSGNRSKKAYDILKDLGYNVYDLGAYDKINLKKS